jgi:hypothetical protein
VVRVPVYRSRGFGFDSWRYQIFWEVVGLERGPLSLVSPIEELLGRKSSGFCLEIREYGRRDPSRWLRGSLYRTKLALTSPASGGRSAGIVRSRTQATVFSFLGTKLVLKRVMRLIQANRLKAHKDRLGCPSFHWSRLTSSQPFHPYLSSIVRLPNRSNNRYVKPGFICIYVTICASWQPLSGDKEGHMEGLR